MGTFILSSKTSLLQVNVSVFVTIVFKFKAEDGLQVIASGNLSVYEPQENISSSRYHEPKGLGSHQLAFEQLKRDYGRRILQFGCKSRSPCCRCIGIVTSLPPEQRSDILKVLKRRHEYVRVLIYPTKVRKGQPRKSQLGSNV